jgi:hypothetical protein
MSGAERNGSIEHMKERKEDARVGGRQGERVGRGWGAWEGTKGSRSVCRELNNFWQVWIILKRFQKKIHILQISHP